MKIATVIGARPQFIKGGTSFSRIAIQDGGSEFMSSYQLMEVIAWSQLS
jgi:hypothetical protein